MTAKTSILIVDDDPMIRMQIAEYFKTEFNVIEIEDGTQILGTIAEHPIEIIILDIFMHTQEGIQSLTTLSQLYPDLPVIMISSDKTYLDMTTILGAKDTMQKPLNLPRLKTMIQNHLAVAA
jgi:DNA-binding NtrC family response regulator